MGIAERVPRVALTAQPDQPLDTLPRGIPDDYGIPTLGWGVLAWALPRFIQPNGEHAGKPFKPTFRQVRFMLWFYVLDERGKFVFRHAVRRLAKGSGKSPFAAFLSLCEFCGPVRFSHWDAAVPGGVVGRPIRMPLVQIAATKEDQTKNTMRHIRQFGSRKSALAKEFGLDPGITIFYHPSVGGELHVLTSSSTGNEGAEPTFMVGDESENWLPNNGGDELYETLDRNLAKSASRMVETCNSWVPGAGAIAEYTWDTFVAQEEGRTRGKTRILYDCIEAPADTDLSDEDSLRRALEFVYSDCPWVDIQDRMERIWGTRRPEVARRMYLNQRVSDEKKWTTPTAWGALVDALHVVVDGAEIVAFFDGSRTSDTTALVGCEIATGHVFEIGVFVPPDGGEIDVAEVDRAVRLMHDRWTVLAFFGDVAEWESYVKTEWPNRYAEDYLISSAPQATPPQSIAWDMRSHKKEFAQAAELCESEINDKLFTHDGASTLARHVVNMQRRPYQQWVSVGKASAHSPNKIDAGVCMIGARMVRRLLLASKAWQERNTPKRSRDYVTW